MFKRQINTNPRIELKKITTQVRPARCATLVNVNDPNVKDGALRIIEWYSHFWGGDFNIIIPSDGIRIEEIFWQILEIYEPDYFCRHIKTVRDLEFYAPETYKKIEQNEIKRFLEKHPDVPPLEIEKIIKSGLQRSDSEIDQFVISDELKKEIVSKLNIFHTEERLAIDYFRTDDSTYRTISIFSILNQIKKENQETAAVMDYEIEKLPKEIQLTIRSNIGSTRTIKKFFDKEIPSRTLDCEELTKTDIEWLIDKIDEKDIYKLANFITDPKGEKVSFTPFILTKYGLGRYVDPKKGLTEKQPIVVVVGDSIKDFCLFYSLKRIMGDVFWLPNILFEQENKILLSHVISNIEDSYRHSAFRDREIVYTSLSKEDLKKEVNQIAESKLIYTEKVIPSRIEIPFDVSKNVKNPLLVFEIGEGVNNSYLEQFLENKSLNFLRTPKPKTFDNLIPLKHRWITDLALSAISGSSDGYILPSKSFFSEDIFREAPNYYSSSSTVRWTKEGISFFCPTMGFIAAGNTMDDILVKPQINLLKSESIFGKIFSQNNLFFRTSDKGNYTRATIEIFGSLNSAQDELEDPEIMSILDCYCDMNTGKKRKDLNIPGVNVIGRSYLSFEDISKFIIDLKKARIKIDKYLKMGILFRGLVLKCEDCKQADWYQMEEIGQRFKCHRCGKEQAYTPEHWRNNNSKEPPFYYKLNEMVFQGYLNNMSATISILCKLKKMALKSFIYLPEIEIRENLEDEKPLVEIDIAAIVDGKVYIGEAKSINKIPDKLTLYNKIVNGIDANFILAGMSREWTLIDKQEVNKLFWNKSPKLWEKKDFDKN